MFTSTLVAGACPRTGAEAFYKDLISRSRFVIAADGGVEVCLTAGRVPDVCIGDFDSASERAVAFARERGAEIIRVPPDKDSSDLELALALAGERASADVTVTAAFSGRPDHLLATFGALLRAPVPRVCGLDPGLACYALDAARVPSLCLDLAPGTVLSLFAAVQDTVVTVAGMRYPLDNEPLDPWTARGLSNVATADGQCVTVHSGSLLVLIAGDT